MPTYRTETLQLVRGDSSDLFNIVVENTPLLDSNWVCEMAILQNLGDTTYIVRKPINQSADNTSFIGGITPTESALLVAKKYYLVFEISNTVVEFRREIKYIIEVLDGGIN